MRNNEDSPQERYPPSCKGILFVIDPLALGAFEIRTCTIVFSSSSTFVLFLN